MYGGLSWRTNETADGDEWKNGCKVQSGGDPAYERGGDARRKF